MKNILHISDLHLSESEHQGFNFKFIEDLINTLVSDLPKNLSEKIDTVFLTGDITHTGSASEFRKAMDLFITPLMGRLELALDNLYLVPGNHDVERSEINISQKLLRKNSSTKDLSEVCLLIETGKEKWGRLDNYLDFQSQLINKQKNVVYNSSLITVRSSGNKIRVHCINSAWLAGDDSDKGCLRILDLLDKSLKKHGKNKTNIVLFHHPTDWLEPSEHTLLSKLLEKNVDALFFGHMHEFEQSITINFSQDITLRLQAGTLDVRNKNSGYSIIKLHTNNDFQYGRVLYRKYEEESKKFSTWDERGKNGIFDFSIDPKALFDSTKFIQLSSTIAEEIDFQHIVNTGKEEGFKSRLSDIFIEPTFSSINNPDVADAKSLNAILNSKSSCVVSGTERNGKSTLLRKIQLHYLHLQMKGDFNNIVFYIDLNESFTSSAKILMTMMSPYLGHDLQTSFESKLKNIIKEGNAVFIIDNVDNKCSDTFKAFTKFLAANISNKFIFSCDSSRVIDAVEEFKKVTDYEIISASINRMKRTDIRKIISLRPFLITTCSPDEVFNNVIKTIDNSQLPHNHFVYSILMEIYENKNSLVGILTEADVIEVYIEILLNKHVLKGGKNKPTYKILVHFMGFIANNMLMQKKSKLKESEYLRIALEFEKLTFHEYKISDYFEPAIQSGIFIKNNSNELEFSNDCFFYYFSAYFMNLDQNLCTYVFSKDNYLHLSKVVEYYSAQNSSKFDVLAFLTKKVESLTLDVSNDINKEHGININELELNSFNNVSFLDMATSIDTFNEKIDTFQSDRDGDDDKLDKVKPLENKVKKKASSALSKLDSDSEKQTHYIEKLTRLKLEISLFSKVFRNTELVMEPDKVIDIFDFIVKSYVFLIKADLTLLDEKHILPILNSQIERKFSHGDISNKEKEKFLESMKIYLSVIRATIPNIIEAAMSSDLATKKPRFKKILNTKLANITNNNEEMLVRFLLMEIEPSNFREHVKILMKNTDKININTLFLKLLEVMHTRYDLHDDDMKFVKITIKKLISTNKIESKVFRKFAQDFDNNISTIT